MTSEALISRECVTDGILACSQEPAPARMPARAYVCSIFAWQVDNVVGEVQGDCIQRTMLIAIFSHAADRSGLRAD